jgi:pyruvate carboxylase
LRALGELEIEGVTSTIAVIRDIVDSEEFRLGVYSTNFIAEVGSRLPALLKG